MQDFFITFSPQADTWSKDQVDTMFDIIHQFLTEEPVCNNYRIITSWGSKHDHYHIHAHILGTSRQGRSIRTSLIRRKDKLTLPTNGFFLRVEKQQGRYTHVNDYFSKNLGELANDKIPNRDVSSDKYNEKMKSLIEGDKVLNIGQLHALLIRRLEERRIIEGGLDEHLIDIEMQQIAQEFFLFRISDFDLQRVIRDMHVHYLGKKFRLRV